MNLMMKTKLIALKILLLTLIACQPADKQQLSDLSKSKDNTQEESSVSRFDIYSKVTLTADLSHLSDNQREMISILIDAAKITDDLFWLQVWGDKNQLLDSIDDPKVRQFAEYNYGPWDRLDSDKPFIEGYGPRPKGARYYPDDMSKSEFDQWQQIGKDGLYSIVQT